jgi:hypothetical protein
MVLQRVYGGLLVSDSLFYPTATSKFYAESGSCRWAQSYSSVLFAGECNP